MRMSLLFGVKTVVDSNRGRLETCRGKKRHAAAGGRSAMPLPGADEGMELLPQPQLLQGCANADLQKLNAARWICFNPRRPARRQANPPYLLPAYTLASRARKSPENAVDPNDDPNADRSGKHRTVFARGFLRLRGFFLSDSSLRGHESANFSCRIRLHISCGVTVGVQREARRVVPKHT